MAKFLNSFVLGLNIREINVLCFNFSTELSEKMLPTIDKNKISRITINANLAEPIILITFFKFYPLKLECKHFYMIMRLKKTKKKMSMHFFYTLIKKSCFGKMPKQLLYFNCLSSSCAFSFHCFIKSIVSVHRYCDRVS